MDNEDRVVIIGGGIIGCMTAVFLKKLGYPGEVSVFERDCSYQHCSTALSAASIRTQFGCAVNVQLSLFGAEFLRNVANELVQDAHVGFTEAGYLILSSAENAEVRRRALAMQRDAGAKVQLVDSQSLNRNYPWLSLDGVALGAFGLSDEGWFDAWALLQAASRKARTLGVKFHQAEVTGFDFDGGNIRGAKLANDEVVRAKWFVNATGAWSGAVSALLDIELPVAPRKRTVYHFKAPLKGDGLPMLFDISGAWMRPEGAGFIGGIQPPAEQDVDATGDFAPHDELFEELYWPTIAERVPALEQLRLLNAWAGHYEMNLMDHNGVVGPHPVLGNFLFGSGFSGHGVMHAPGIGRGLAEYICFGQYQSIDLSTLGYQRILDNKPLTEESIY